MKQIKEKRHASKYNYGACHPVWLSVEQRERSDGRTERHQQEKERWRILPRINERENGKRYVLLNASWSRIPVNISCANDDEGKTQAAEKIHRIETRLRADFTLHTLARLNPHNILASYRRYPSERRFSICSEVSGIFPGRVKFLAKA